MAHLLLVLCCRSGLAISEAEVASGPTNLLTAAEVTIQDCVFRNSQAMYGGCLSLGILKSLLLSGSSFDRCTGLFSHRGLFASLSFSVHSFGC